jgi:DNA-binding transcriptional ArsR family regulator
MTDLGRFKSEFFKALAHPLRIAVIDELRDGEIGVNELCERLSVEQSALSQQLAILRVRNIVVGRKEGAQRLLLRPRQGGLQAPRCRKANLQQSSDRCEIHAGGDERFANRPAAMKAFTSMFEIEDWLPRSVSALKTYSTDKFVSDLIAGVTVGLVALPLAMAFAIASGVSPEAGLYCAVVAGFLISALGGSSTQIGGPTGAFVVVVYGIVSRYGIDGLYMCTLLAGLMLVVLGATGLGSAVKYIPRPVVIGFTNGIALLIASTQIKDFLGLKTGPVPGDFLGRMQVLALNLNTVSWTETVLGLLGIAVIVLCMRYLKRIPGYVIALFAGTMVVWLFGIQVETIGTRFGGIPSGLPSFRLPTFRSDLILPLISPAITVAMLGAIESLMSAVVSDRMSGGKHKPNVELIAQGVANIASPLFGGLPATGAIARTCDQRSIRRQDSGGRNDPRIDAPLYPAVRSAPGQVHPLCRYLPQF